MKRQLYLTVAAVLPFMLMASCEKGGNGIQAPELTAAEIVRKGETLSVDVGKYTPVDLIWSAGGWNGDGHVSYKAVIDAGDGDFSEPLKTYVPLEGTLSVFIPKADIDEIWNAVSGEWDGTGEVSIKWAVETSAGGMTLRSSAQYIMMTRSEREARPFETGMPVFVAGEGASEAGGTMNCVALYPFKIGNSSYNDGQAADMETFDYEAFTVIEAGQPFFLSYGDDAASPDGYMTFEDAPLGESGNFSFSGEKPEGGFTVENTSIYRIRLNVGSGRILIQNVEAVRLRCFGREMNDKGKWVQSFTTDFDMEYIGNGTWKKTGLDVKWGNKDYATRFDTYKFNVRINGKDQLYGAMDQALLDAMANVNPDRDTDAGYWSLQTVTGGAVTGKGAFRLPGWLISEAMNPAFSADIVLHLNFGGRGYYCHEFINENAK